MADEPFCRTCGNSRVVYDREQGKDVPCVECSASSDKDVFNGAVKAYFEVRQAIHELYKNTGIGVGSIRCPICKGTLDWSVQKKRNHIHAKCRTPNCLTFME